MSVNRRRDSREMAYCGPTARRGLGASAAPTPVDDSQRRACAARRAVDVRVPPVYKKGKAAVSNEARLDHEEPTMTSESSEKPTQGQESSLEHLDAAVNHVDELISSGNIAVSAARGLLYSLIETLGALVGDPDLPEHSRSGYEGLLETARELRMKLGK
jgi:hypothetical protein